MRHFLLFLFLLLTPLGAEAAERQYGLSLFDEVDLPENFPHFPYVNPNAKKGGEIKIGALGSFDSLNPFILKGQADGYISMIYESLMEQSGDEATSSYGRLAKSFEIADDYSHVTFYLNEKAKWHDGKPITADDVVWSFTMIKRNLPLYKAYYANVVKAQALNKHTVRFSFDVKNNHELPLIVTQFQILPKHYWTSNGRDINKTTLEIPLGSGPYRISEVVAGRKITYERVKNYWGRHLNISQGRYNFDKITREYFGDDSIALEALKAGQLSFREEYSSKNWMQAYNINKVKKGDILREKITTEEPQGMQAFVFNIRRDIFKDIHVRKALALAFDFEWANKNLFFGQYQRTHSYFENTELAAKGLPSQEELEILNRYKKDIPPEVFTKPFTLPVNDKRGSLRIYLRQAKKLLHKAGWRIKKGKLMKDGKPMQIEMLLVSPAFERVVAPYAQTLKKLGIEMRWRVVDSSQYQNRLIAYDFDMIIYSFRESLSPGNEQRDYWSSAAADRPGGRNLIGIKNKAVDGIIDEIIFVKDRKTLIHSVHALDRILLWNYYVIPQWYAPYHRLAYWKGLRHPKNLPRYSIGFPHIWWYEKEE